MKMGDKPICSGTRRDGQPCRAIALPGRSLCRAHLSPGKPAKPPAQTILIRGLDQKGSDRLHAWMADPSLSDLRHTTAALVTLIEQHPIPTDAQIRADLGSQKKKKKRRDGDEADEEEKPVTQLEIDRVRIQYIRSLATMIEAANLGQERLGKQQKAVKLVLEKILPFGVEFGKNLAKTVHIYVNDPAKAHAFLQEIQSLIRAMVGRIGDELDD